MPLKVPQPRKGAPPPQPPLKAQHPLQAPVPLPPTLCNAILPQCLTFCAWAQGDILLNGHEADPVTFNQFAGYVEQMDVHSSTMTVSEALLFSARLRLPREVPDADKEAHVWQIVEMLNLQPFAHSLIGTREDGLSVEQVKRVTIGVEMAANPAVLFLDELTSGLDSMAADLVLEALMAVKRTVPHAVHWEGGGLTCRAGPPPPPIRTPQCTPTMNNEE